VGEWVRDFFDERYAAAVMDAVPAGVTDMHARWVVGLLGLKVGQRVLDIPCGTGCLALALTKAGLQVTGVDLSQRYVEQARERARSQGLDVRLLCADMREISFQAEFDAAVCWGDSLGYFPDAETLRFCSRLHEALRPGGGLVAEFTNKAWLARARLPEAEIVTCGMRVRQSGHYDAARSRFVATWVYTGADGAISRQLSMRVYSRTELRALLRSAGFRNVQFRQSYPTFGPASRDSQQIAAVARR
jgi:2-polyprenyl-3-methyl-5-hydroxy-6-metoxy-1,4-benzoquinol methylase